jgi:hypothetical protein
LFLSPFSCVPEAALKSYGANLQKAEKHGVYVKTFVNAYVDDWGRPKVFAVPRPK